MKIYYAHPMKLYGTPAEQKELAQIRKRFPHRIVNPALYENDPAKLLDRVGYCLKLVETVRRYRVHKIPRQSYGWRWERSESRFASREAGVRD